MTRSDEKNWADMKVQFDAPALHLSNPSMDGQFEVADMFSLNLAGDQATVVNIPDERVFLIGRSPDCHLSVRDPSASRVHCRLIACDGVLTLYDAGSRWGTFVNSQRIFERQLIPGDVIRLGATSIEVRGPLYHALQCSTEFGLRFL